MENKIPVIIDDDPSAEYEKNKWSCICKLPLMWILAFWVALKKKVLGSKLKINTYWFDGSSPICRKVKENATTWRALDIIYNYYPGKDKSFGGRIADFWNEIKNIKAIRNRLRLVKRQLRENIKKFSKSEKQTRLVSIASGSAQGIIGIMKELKQKGIIVNAIFLDLDPTAIEHSKNLAKQAEIINQITFVNKSTRELKNVVTGFKPQIIEVTGLLEYRPDEKAINLLKRVYDLLVPEGVLLTSNISPNPEKFFSYWVGNWPLIYRTVEQLSEIIIKAGFNPKNCRIIQEPLRIHNIAVCKKTLN
ncbi:class I SAM-dependent methyltransferase family protein [Patescibacteria group bacterium]|nr:class I SAM-dependent methyltransferase family protein [Patescibacteria group bacterium]